jgi:hypothetical protein
MGGCIIKQLAAKAYVAGTHPNDRGIITAGSASISVFAISLYLLDQHLGEATKQPDLSFGFPD